MQLRKLHLGAGKNYLPGWTNVDLFSSVQADLYADITNLPLERDSFDLIYASHVLEHVHRNMVLATLSHWRDLLKAGGVLRLAVPDFGACVDRYNKNHDLREITGLLWGGQNHPRNNHFIGFDYTTLSRSLYDVGFKEIGTWDWRKTDHAQFDDYSQAYLPAMQKEDGQLMSLNMEAVK